MGMFCKKCRYDLSHCVSSACPECGRGFDADDPATYALRATRGARGVKIAVAVLLSATLLGILEYHPHYVRARTPKAGGAGTGGGYIVADIAVMRNAIEAYAKDHAGTYPTLAELQSGVLTRKHTCAAGHTHGPYIRRIVPAHFNGSTRINARGRATAQDGWAYDETTGMLWMVVADTAEYQSIGYGPDMLVIAARP